MFPEVSGCGGENTDTLFSGTRYFSCCACMISYQKRTEVFQVLFRRTQPQLKSMCTNHAYSILDRQALIQHRDSMKSYCLKEPMIPLTSELLSEQRIRKCLPKQQPRSIRPCRRNLQVLSFLWKLQHSKHFPNQVRHMYCCMHKEEMLLL